MKANNSLALSSVVAGMAMALACTGFGGTPSPAVAHGTTEAEIARLTTNLLEQSQFAHHPFDDRLAGELLDRYLDSLDGSRKLLLKTDVDALAPYRAALATGMREAGDTRVARVAFDRYLQRLGERAAYVARTLKTTTFDFTRTETYALDREHAERPADLTAAKGLWLQQLRAEYLDEKLAGKKPDQIVSTLTKRYERQVDTMKALSPDEVLEVYLNALAHVYDPHSDYFGHEQMEGFSTAMSLSLVGIGATLQADDGYCKIHDLVPGGPAARNGLLKSGDRIVAVAQSGHEPVDVINVPLSRTVEMIRGPKGSTVTLKVLRAGAPEGATPETIALTRDEIKLQDQEAKARIVDLPRAAGAPLRLGVIDLPSFYASTNEGERQRSATADVARLLGKLKTERVQGVVLDLRQNGGGSLEEAISLTGLFIRKGPVVQTRDQAGKIDVGTDNDASVLYDGPLVVLTSRFTASASEIVAGALQDYGRALIVGDPSTFGKGTVQNVVPLAHLMDRLGLPHAYDPGALKVTIDKFYRPSGTSTQLRGVTSDIVVPSTTDLKEVSESALQGPLPWDVVPPQAYEPVNRVAPSLGVLRQRSADRVAASQDFTDIEADEAHLRRTLDAKSVSLNEADRRLELTRNKARNEQRERAAREANARRPTTYEITLENLAAPGLPRPVDFAKERRPGASGDLHDDNGVAESAPDPKHAADVVLDEGERILTDYVGALQGPQTLALSASPSP